MTSAIALEELFRLQMTVVLFERSSLSFQDVDGLYLYEFFGLCNHIEEIMKAQQREHEKMEREQKAAEQKARSAQRKVRKIR